MTITAIAFAALAAWFLFTTLIHHADADRWRRIADWRQEDIEALRDQLADAQARNLRPGDTPLYLVSRDACRERGDLA